MSALQSIKPSKEELAAGKLSDATLARAVEIMNADGLLMIEDVVDHAHLDALNERMTKDAYTLWNSGYRKGPEDTGNIQLDPPSAPELFFPDVFLNPFAVAVTTAYFGGRPRMTFSSGNAAMYGTKSQDVHSDFGDFGKVPTTPFAVVVNTGLVEMSPENGSTELWVGTHLTPRSTPAADALVTAPSAPNKILPSALAARHAAFPAKGPFQPRVPKGALIIRDLRIWHCGRPNARGRPAAEGGAGPRIMLAQIYFAPWWGNRMRLAYPRGMEWVAERTEVEVVADFVDGGVDHLKRTTEHTFDFSRGEGVAV